MWRTPSIFVLVGGAIVAIGIAAPVVLKPVYVGWLMVAYPISWTISNVLLAATYFLVFTTFATIFRVVGRDELRRSFDPKASTYWRERRRTPAASQYFKQF